MALFINERSGYEEMSSCTYVVPLTLQSTLQTLSQKGRVTQALAGGTCLLVDMRQGTIQPDMLLDLRKLVELRQIHWHEQTVSIGAMVTFSQLEHERVIQEQVPLLAQMAVSLGNPLIRNAATLGGNIASARALNTDAAVPLLALDAQLVLQMEGPVTRRTISIAEYLLQEPDLRELITWIQVPVCMTGSHSFYTKLSKRRSGAATIVSIATHIALQENRMRAARIVLGGFAPLPFRSQRIEAVLEGETGPLRGAIIEHCADLLRADLPEASHDTMASASYRSAMCCVLLKKALERVH